MRKNIRHTRNFLQHHPVPNHIAVIFSILILAVSLPLAIFSALDALQNPPKQIAVSQKIGNACQYKKICTTTNGTQNCDSYVLSCNTTNIPSPIPSSTSSGPVGFLEKADCSQAIGWSYNPQIPGKIIHVLFYADGPAPQRLLNPQEINQNGSTVSGKYVTEISANLRLDSNDVVEIFGNHEFLLPIPFALKDGNLHELYAYSVESSSSAAPSLLLGSPRQIACAATVPPFKTQLELPQTKVPGTPKTEQVVQ